MTVKVCTKKQVEKLLEKYNTFLFDCDGVIWIGNQILPHVRETIKMLQDKGKKPIFVSNNSTKARNEYITKLESLGIDGIDISQIINSAYSTAIYVHDVLKLPINKKIHVLGKEGLCNELRLFGYEVVNYDQLVKNGAEITMDNITTFVDPDVACVVVGLDFDVTYLKLGLTLQYLLRKEITFVATNIDSTFPYGKTKLPGAGSIVETVSFASGRQPDAICGKPYNGMMDSILVHHQLNKGTTIMVGDRLNTDMKFGNVNGIDTLLVLTGIEPESAVANGHDDVTYYADKLGDLYELSV